MTVLLVHVAEEAAERIRTALTGTGDSACTVLVAADARTAADLVGRVRPDVILFDLAGATHPLERFARIQLIAGAAPIVVLADEQNESDALRVVRAGADDYLLRDQLHETLLRRSLRHAIQHRRAAAEAAFNAQLLSYVDQAVMATDLDGRILYWNPAAGRLFGWSAAEVLGARVRDLVVVPESLPVAREAMADLLAGRSMRRDLRLRRRDGSEFVSETIMSPLRDDSGSVVGVISAVTDITARLASAQALRDSEQKLRLVFERLPIVSWTTDSHLRITSVIGSMLLDLGLDADDLIGRPLHTIMPDEPGVEQMRRALNGEDVTWLREFGDHWFDVQVRPLHDSSGSITGTIGIGLDITERRRLEEQFVEARKMEAVARLAGGVAHEFNNLLTAIAGSAELLLERLQDGASRTELDEVLRSVDRANVLTRQLLAFSQRQVLQTRVLDVNDVARGAADMLRRLLGPGYALSMDLQSPLPPVRADHSQIEQVMLHLVTNAREAMPGGGSISLGTGVRAVDPDELPGVAEGTWVELVVADRGAGMEPSVLSRIFEPFFTTRMQGQATGLGLPTVHGIVTQSGGHIMVESEPGVGTTFRVLLPPAPEEAAADEAATDEAAADEAATDAGDGVLDHDSTGSGGSEPSSRSGGGSGETILLVEDEAAVLRLGVRILERSGYSVVAAASGDEALSLFPDIAPDVAVLVTDVMMPGLNGIELARRLQFMKPGLRVLLTSGYTADIMSGEAVLPPGTAFLEKPFTPRSLGRKVRELLDAEPAPE